MRLLYVLWLTAASIVLSAVLLALLGTASGAPRRTEFITPSWYPSYVLERTLEDLDKITLKDVVLANVDKIEISNRLLPYHYAVPQDRTVVLSYYFVWMSPEQRMVVLMHEVGHVVTANVMATDEDVPCTYGALGETRAQAFSWVVAYPGMNPAFARQWADIPDGPPLYGSWATEDGCVHAP